MAGPPAAFVVSLIAVILNRSRGFGIAGLVISAGTLVLWLLAIIFMN